MADVFISYARANYSTAEGLSRSFEARGWSVWWDQSIDPGQFFPDVIEKELEKARCIVTLWSKESIQSIWVRTESAEGLKRRILIPVRVENVIPPIEFRTIQTADLLDWKPGAPHSGYDRLVRAIAQRLEIPQGASIPEWKPPSPAQHLETPVAATAPERKPPPPIPPAPPPLPPAGKPKRRQRVTLGDVMMVERKRKRMSLEEMARKLDLPIAEYQEIEDGDSPAELWGPLLGKIAIKLEIPTSRLLAESGKSLDTSPGRCGFLIQKNRERKGKTVEELAESLEITRAELLEIESGQSPLEKYGPILLHFAELIEQPVFNLFYPYGLPLDKLERYS